MEKGKAPRLIAGILFILCGIIIFLIHYSADILVMRAQIFTSAAFQRLNRLIHQIGRDMFASAQNNGGLRGGILVAVPFLLIGAGLLSGKRFFTAFGAAIGIIAQILIGTGALFLAERTQAAGIPFRFGFASVYYRWPFVLLGLNLLLLLVYLTLLIAAVGKRTAKVCGWIGGGFALLRILPLSFAYHYVVELRLLFYLSPLGGVWAIMLAAAVVLAGYGMAPRDEPAGIPPQAPYYAPPQMTGYPPQAWNATGSGQVPPVPPAPQNGTQQQTSHDDLPG